MANFTPAPKTTAYAKLSPLFEGLLTSLQKQAEVEAVVRDQGGQAAWMVPPLNAWDGDLFDWDGMHKPFDRDEISGQFIKALATPAAPGRTGDLIITTAQIDLLAVAERAYRMRHTLRRPRALAQACGRKMGHGRARGPLQSGLMGYVQGLIRETNRPGASVAPIEVT